jgi:hypothetical protein
MFGTYFYDFKDGHVTVLAGLEDAFARERGNTDRPFDKHLQHELFGKGMYENRSYGACTSKAVYLTTGLRAIGIPTRMVLMIPILDGNDGLQIELVRRGLQHPEVREKILKALSGSNVFAAHTFNEVFVSGRWHRLDGRLGSNIDSTFGLMIHVNTFDDLSDANLARTWGWRYGKREHNDIFRTNNPYRTTEIADRIGIHAGMTLPKPKQLWEKTGNISILSAYWWHELPADDWRRRSSSPWRNNSKAGHLLLHANWATGARLNSSELVRLLTKIDRHFHLIGDKGERIALEISASSVWPGKSGETEFEIVIPKTVFEQMPSGTEYSLEPLNPKDAFKWIVADKVRIIK